MTERSALPRGDKPDPAALYRLQEEPLHLLLAKDEISWITRAAEPDKEVDAFLLLGCGVRGIPHLMRDSVAVLDALGVRAVAAAGPQFCCGNPYRPDRLDAADRLTASSMDRMTAWGATTIAHWCTACQLTYGAWSRGDEMLWTGSGTVPLATRGPQDIENIHIHTFIERRLRELGDRVPWKRELRRRVLVEGHPELTEVHDVARSSAARILAMVPGIEVLGWAVAPQRFKSDERSNCNSALAGLSVHDVQQIRAEIAAQLRARGADTISCQHHNCHRTWSRFASDTVTVQQAVSIVAEALGVVSPDRYQQFARLGDPEAIVDRSEPIWRSWDLTREEAGALARKLFDTKWADRPSCACGGDVTKCDERSPIAIGELVRSDRGTRASA